MASSSWHTTSHRVARQRCFRVERKQLPSTCAEEAHQRTDCSCKTQLRAIATLPTEDCRRACNPCNQKRLCIAILDGNENGGAGHHLITAASGSSATESHFFVGQLLAIRMPNTRTALGAPTLLG